MLVGKKDRFFRAHYNDCRSKLYTNIKNWCGYIEGMAGTRVSNNRTQNDIVIRKTVFKIKRYICSAYYKTIRGRGGNKR